MIWAEIDWSRCQVCVRCMAQRACKLRAIVKLEDEPAYIELDRCRGCGVCMPACEFQAVHIRRHPYQDAPPE